MKYSTMKFFLTVIFCSGFLMNVSAQVSGQTAVSPYGNSPHESFQLLSGQSTYSISLNDNYLFLVNDNKQKVLFNPARASATDYGFVQTSFTGGASDNFDAAILVPAKTGSWFITLGGAVDSDDTDSELEDFYQNFYVRGVAPSRTETLEEQLTIETINRRNEENQAEFRLLKVFESGAGSGKAVGVFGGFSKVQQSNVRTNSEDFFQEIQNFRMDTLFSRSEYEKELRDRNSTKLVNNKLIAGIEYYSWTENGDMRHRFYIQRNDFDYQNEGFWRSESITEITIINDENRDLANARVQEDQNISTAEPWQFRYDIYKNKHLNLLGDDYLFGNLQFVFGFGDQVAYMNAQRVESNTVNGETESQIIYDFEEELEDPKTNFIGGRFSTGYAVTFNAEDFALVTGVNPYYELSFEAVNRLNGADKQEVSVTQQHIGGELPAFVMFDIGSNVKLWGGGSLNVNHSGVKTEIEETPYEAVSDREIPDIESVNHFRETNFQQNIYVGISYLHDSGFGINANTRGNWSNLNNWFVSFSYQF